MSSSGGSSPRVRGKLANQLNPHIRPRLIPACAGKTPRGPGYRGGSPAHPRVCGENQRGFHNTDAVAGSSPRVRGKPEGGGLGGDRVRLIPACAGKTDGTATESAPTRAHPRVCGENVRPFAGALRVQGSSPRVRGKRDLRQVLLCRVRLIPARAGKTTRRRPVSPSPPAHPRACGENVLAASSASSTPGSSPRVRGKRHRRRVVSIRVGLIPARAGKTQMAEVLGEH